MTIPDHYAVLGVAPNASRSEIRAARQRCLRLHHPDVSPNDTDAARRDTMAILVAGEVLADHAARAAYDRALTRERRRDGSASGRPREEVPASRRMSGALSPDIACGACGHVNVHVRRNSCLFCGAGIGPTPRPITLEHVRWRHTGTSLFMNLGCGLLLGGVPMGLLALRWTLTHGLSTSVGLFVGVPAVAGAILAAIASGTG